MRTALLFLFAVQALHAAITTKTQGQPWSEITVEVQASQAVSSSQQLVQQPDGFQRVAVVLTNNSRQNLTLGRITIRIPLSYKLTTDMEMLQGGSCMGRTPVQRQTIGNANKLASSHMYGMVRLCDGQYIFAGALTWRVFLPNFTLHRDGFEVWSDGEGRQLKPGESVPYEQIVLAHTDNWLTLLDHFGAAIASENGIEKTKKADFKGWATWDYYGHVFSAEDIHRNLDAIHALDSSCNLLQIDAGWYTARGDYSSVRPDLPGGMKALTERIRAKGMTPGVWIDGFRANSNSEICRSHPEYFLHDQDGNMITEQRKREGRDRDRVYFDYSHPGARAHIAQCIRLMREEWGISYFKIDFLRFGLDADIKAANRQVKSIRAHDPTLTSVERFRLGMQVMREAVGRENYLLGCSAVFGPCIGLVDGMRTGGDINPRYEAFPERVLANLGNFYLNGRVFNGDADYLVFREAADEDPGVSAENVKHGGTLPLNEARMWADFSKLYGNCRLGSDNLMTLRPERRALLGEVLQFPAAEQSVPLDLWRHASGKGDAFERILARNRKGIFLGLFNWGDRPREYSLAGFHKDGTVTLEPRHSLLIKYEGTDSFEQLCELLQSK